VSYIKKLTNLLKKVIKLGVRAIVFMILIGLFFSSYVLAKVSGLCSNCHTMHYSQHGDVLSGWGTEGPYQNLLVNDCVGCHTGVNDGTNTTPYVFSETEPSYGTNTLAGGNFYWVAHGYDECGHNVTDIPGVGQDSNFTETPGLVSGKTCSCCHGSGNMVLTKCVFCHDPKHHGDDSGPVVGDDEEVKYRFLSFTAFHPYTFQEGSYNFYGVAGIEDDDWEYTVSSSDHNEYCGAASSGDYSGASHSISRYCAACHWGFYGDNTGHWKRHPSDYALPDRGEYADYATYNPLAPIARPEGTLIAMTGSSSTITPGQDQVSCLSCHRAHGSPYPKLMRWDYKNWPGGENGCNVCHTEKD